MWWTNSGVSREYTSEEIRDPSDVHDKAIELFKDRRMMYPCLEMINATSIYLKQNIFDIRSLPSWHKSRICLIGDAAHAVIHRPFNLIDFRSLQIRVREHRWP